MNPEFVKIPIIGYVSARDIINWKYNRIDNKLGFVVVKSDIFNFYHVVEFIDNIYQYSLIKGEK